MNFIGNFFLFPVVQKFKNWLRFDKVTTMSLVAPFLEHGVYEHFEEYVFLKVVKITHEITVVREH